MTLSPRNNNEIGTYEGHPFNAFMLSHLAAYRCLDWQVSVSVEMRMYSPIKTQPPGQRPAQEFL
jgi:hypothetical protein